MCIGGSTPSYTVTETEDEPDTPSSVDSDVQQARTDEKNAARAAAGRSGQIKTDSGLETTEVNTASRTLLG